jgi:hypothetical protein
MKVGTLVVLVWTAICASAVPIGGGNYSCSDYRGKYCGDYRGGACCGLPEDGTYAVCVNRYWDTSQSCPSNQGCGFEGGGLHCGHGDVFATG